MPTKSASTDRPRSKAGRQAIRASAKPEDAIRLLKWGKSWHELAELIERIAERPPAAEIRKVLRANRAEIEEKAGVEG